MVLGTESELIELSPTATAKYRLCTRAYAFEYNEGLRPPPGVKQQFGTSVHKQIENWLRNGQPPDDSPEGKTAKQGLHWLPRPDPLLRLEQKFVFSVTRDILVGGIIDCLVPPELTGAEPLLIDQKTTSDLRWAKTEEQLETDPQALIYAVWAMLTWQVPVVKARWVYYAATNGCPREPRGSRPVEFSLSVHSQTMMNAVSKLVTDFEAMAKIRREKKPGLAFPPSPESCSMFGGCYHRERCKLTPEDRLAAYMDRDKVV